MAVDPAIQSQLDSAEAQVHNDNAYAVTVVIDTRTISWISANKVDLRDTLTAAVNKTKFKSATVQVGTT